MNNPYTAIRHHWPFLSFLVHHLFLLSLNNHIVFKYNSFDHKSRNYLRPFTAGLCFLLLSLLLVFFHLLFLNFSFGLVLFHESIESFFQLFVFVLAEPRPHLHGRVQVAALAPRRVVRLVLGRRSGVFRYQLVDKFLGTQHRSQSESVVVHGCHTATFGFDGFHGTARRAVDNQLQRLILREQVFAIGQQFDTVLDGIRIENARELHLPQSNRLAGIQPLHGDVHGDGAEIDGRVRRGVFGIVEAALGKLLPVFRGTAVEQRVYAAPAPRLLTLVASAARLTSPTTDAASFAAFLFNRARIVGQHVEFEADHRFHRSSGGSRGKTGSGGCYESMRML